MLRFFLRRFAASLLLVWVVLTLTFGLLHLAPGDPLWIYESPTSTEAQKQHLREIYGLDKPVIVQYLVWLGGVARGDWGTSITQQRGAAGILAERFDNTLILVIGVLLVEYGLGMPLGVVGAALAGSRVDLLIRALSLFLLSVPVFGLGLLFIEVLAVRWDWFPVGQMRSDDASGLLFPWRLLDTAHHLVLPALALGLRRAATVGRYVRNGLLEVLSQDYIRTARAMGLSPARILWVHAMKNAIGPLIQRFGGALPGLLSGAVVVEVVFAWPGLGRAGLAALSEQDYPVVLALTGFTAVLVVLGSLMADLLHAAIDPRVRDHVS